MDERIQSITVWLESRLPDHRVLLGETAEHSEWRFDPGEDLPTSRLRIPLEYLTSEELPGEGILDFLERVDFPELVEGEEGLCRVVGRDDTAPGGELVLREC